MNYAYDCKKKPEVVGFFKAQTKLAHLTTLWQFFPVLNTRKQPCDRYFSIQGTGGMAHSIWADVSVSAGGQKAGNG